MLQQCCCVAAVVVNGVSTGLDIGLSNYSLMLITLSFYTMCKSTTPVFLLMFAFIWGIERWVAFRSAADCAVHQFLKVSGSSGPGHGPLYVPADVVAWKRSTNRPSIDIYRRDLGIAHSACRPSWSLAGVVLVICTGLLLLVAGETRFDLVGLRLL